MLRKWGWTFAYGFLGLVFAGAIAFKVFQPVQVLPRIRLAPGFYMFDHEGRPFTSEGMRGTVVLYGFWYSRCPDPCFHVLDDMAYVARGLAQVPEIREGNIPVAFVVVSLDPRHDTPQVLAEYARRMEQETGQTWYFVTHPDEEVLKTYVGGGFQVYYERLPDGSIRFDPTYILVDGWGIIRGEYKYETVLSTRDRILRHFGVLGEEILNSKGASKLAYEAAHLFLCYAP